jgi:metallo-beta-lactamase family protein
MSPVNADVQVLENISAHADCTEIMQWLSHFKKPPQKVFLVHGEPDSAKSFKDKIDQQLHWNCEIPKYLQKVNL